METALNQRADWEEAARARSLAYLAQFGRGSFAPFLQALAEDYSGQVPGESFAYQMGQVLLAFGPQQALLGSEVARQGDGTVVEVTCLHILRKLRFTFQYNERGEVARFELKLAPLMWSPRAQPGGRNSRSRSGIRRKSSMGC